MNFGVQEAGVERENEQNQTHTSDQALSNCERLSETP